MSILRNAKLILEDYVVRFPTWSQLSTMPGSVFQLQMSEMSEKISLNMDEDVC